MNARLAALVSLVLVLVTSASPTLAEGNLAVAHADVPRASSSPGDAVRAGEALAAFGLDLYRALSPEQTNMVFSPTSIALALAMARAGARGQTAAEMDAVMHELASDEHASWLTALDRALASRSGTATDDSGKDLPVTLRIANAPFAQEGMPLETAYLETLAARLGAGLRLVDYRSRTEEARGTSTPGWTSGPSIVSRSCSSRACSQRRHGSRSSTRSTSKPRGRRPSNRRRRRWRSSRAPTARWSTSRSWP